jgi:hypothetical protein
LKLCSSSSICQRRSRCLLLLLAPCTRQAVLQSNLGTWTLLQTGLAAAVSPQASAALRCHLVLPARQRRLAVLRSCLRHSLRPTHHRQRKLLLLLWRWGHRSRRYAGWQARGARRQLLLLLLHCGQCDWPLRKLQRHRPWRAHDWRGTDVASKLLLLLCQEVLRSGTCPFASGISVSCFQQKRSSNQACIVLGKPRGSGAPHLCMRGKRGGCARHATGVQVGRRPAERRLLLLLLLRLRLLGVLRQVSALLRHAAGDGPRAGGNAAGRRALEVWALAGLHQRALGQARRLRELRAHWHLYLQPQHRPP